MLKKSATNTAAGSDTLTTWPSKTRHIHISCSDALSATPLPPTPTPTCPLKRTRTQLIEVNRLRLAQLNKQKVSELTEIVKVHFVCDEASELVKLKESK